MEKRTLREMFNDVIVLASENGRDDLVEFAESRIALLDKKSTNKKPSKTAEANEVLKSVVLQYLTSEPVTVTELMKKAPEFSGLSNQKVSAILRLMLADGTVVKTADKKRSLYALA